MTGDQACTVEARMTGGGIRLEGPVPTGCAYYCGARVGFDGASFDRKGSTAAEAMKAKDPAGDPLCQQLVDPTQGCIYLYYVLANDAGGHAFAVTPEQHQANVDRAAAAGLLD